MIPDEPHVGSPDDPAGPSEPSPAAPDHPDVPAREPGPPGEGESERTEPDEGGAGPPPRPPPRPPEHPDHARDPREHAPGPPEHQPPPTEHTSGPPAASTDDPPAQDPRPKVEGFPAPGHRARIIAVANQKGGVGKSTTAVNLGAALAEEGATVLLIDMDPQGNASTGLGIPPQERRTTTYEVMASGVAAERAVMPTALERLSAIPSTIDLAGAEIELVSQFSREMRLSRALDGVADSYDYVILDCPPSLGLLTVNSLAAADELIVPIQCEYYALEGLGQLLRNVRLVQQNLNPGLRLTGIVLTMYDSRTKLAEQVVAEVRRYFGSRVYDTLIPRSVRLSEAPGYGQPITSYDGASKGAKAYRALAREVASGPREADAPIPTEDMPAVILPEPTPDEDAQGEEDDGDEGKPRRRLFGRKGGET